MSGETFDLLFGMAWLNFMVAFLPIALKSIANDIRNQAIRAREQRVLRIVGCKISRVDPVTWELSMSYKWTALLTCLLLTGCSQTPVDARKPVIEEETGDITPLTEEEFHKFQEELRQWMKDHPGEKFQAPAPIDLQPLASEVAALRANMVTKADLEALRPKTKNAVKATTEQTYRLILLGSPACGPCKQIDDLCRSGWLKADWSYGTTADNDIQYVHDDNLARSLGVTEYPAFILVRDGVEVGRVIPGTAAFNAEVFVIDAQKLFNEHRNK